VGAPHARILWLGYRRPIPPFLRPCAPRWKGGLNIFLSSDREGLRRVLECTLHASSMQIYANIYIMFECIVYASFACSPDGVTAATSSKPPKVWRICAAYSIELLFVYRFIHLSERLSPRAVCARGEAAGGGSHFHAEHASRRHGPNPNNPNKDPHNPE
jgi:hypothetical protein